MKGQPYRHAHDRHRQRDMDDGEPVRAGLNCYAQTGLDDDQHSEHSAGGDEIASGSQLQNRDDGRRNG